MSNMLDFIKKNSYCFYEQNDIILDILELAPKLYDCFEIPSTPSLLNWDKLHYRRFNKQIIISRNFYTLNDDKTTTESFNFEMKKEIENLNKLLDSYFNIVVEIFSELARGLGIDKDVNVESLSWYFIKYYKRNPIPRKRNLPQMGTHTDDKTFSMCNSTHPGLLSKDNLTGKWLPLFRTPSTSAIFLGTQQSLYPAREHMVKFLHPKIKTRYSICAFF